MQSNCVSFVLVNARRFCQKNSIAILLTLLAFQNVEFVHETNVNANASTKIKHFIDSIGLKL